MKRILSVLCIISMLASGFSAISSNAAETDEPCTEVVDAEPSAWYFCYNNAYASNYNGNLCVSISTQATEKMAKIGLKDLTVQYSYDGSNWYNEWNAGDFLACDTNRYSLSNYIMALDRNGCYYRISCTHYAQKSFLNTQSVSNTSNAVWIG